MTSRSTIWRVWLLLLLSLAGNGVSADSRITAASVDVEYWTALDTDDGDQSLQRLTLLPAARVALSRHWQADGALRIEFADDATGLGSLQTYDTISEPWNPGSDVRAEIDEATITWRDRSTLVTLGKQSVAWGVLDGLQVTDRFDATRLRDAFLVDPRPQRLTRWGARLRFAMRGWRFDAATALDSTVSQPAAIGDRFFPLAPRLRGGIAADAPLPDLSVDLPSEPTSGLRMSRTFGRGDLSVLALRGPETEPQFIAGSSGVILRYPNRSLYGVTWEQAAGSSVWRLEMAYVPDQPLNLSAGGALLPERRQRWLGGVGVDWRGRNGLFVNAQIGIDQIASGAIAATRPQRDVITTLRIHRDVSNNTRRYSVEWLSSLTDGDHVLRPAINWQLNDQLRLSAGVDYITGSGDGLFGQFADTSRAWLKVNVALQAR